MFTFNSFFTIMYFSLGVDSCIFHKKVKMLKDRFRNSFKVDIFEDDEIFTNNNTRNISMVSQSRNDSNAMEKRHD